MNYFYLSHWLIFIFIVALLQFWLLQNSIRNKNYHLRVSPTLLKLFSIIFVVLYIDLPVLYYLLGTICLCFVAFRIRKMITFLIGLNIGLFFYFKIQIVPNELMYGLSYILFFSLSFLFFLSKANLPKIKMQDSFLNFIFYPPHVLSGPFITFDKIMSKELEVNDEDLQKRSFLLITWGLFVAFSSLHIEKWINSYALSLNLTNWLVLHLIMIKNLGLLYAHFSSWSNIAIGVSGLMGLRFPLNFELPLLATNPSDFWRRWHISLADFFSTYVYLPIVISLNRISFLKKSPKVKIYLSLFATWILIGVWHGFEWRYFIWSTSIPLSIFLFSFLPKTHNRIYLLVKWIIHTYFLMWITTLFVSGSDFFKNFYIKDERAQSNEIVFAITVVIVLSCIFPTLGDWFFKKINFDFKLSIFNFIIFILSWLGIFLLIGNQGVPIYGKY